MGNRGFESSGEASELPATEGPGGHLTPRCILPAVKDEARPRRLHDGRTLGDASSLEIRNVDDKSSSRQLLLGF